MTQRPKFQAPPLVIGGACFLAGVALTLLWSSFSRLSPQAHESSVVYSNTSDAFNSDAAGRQSLKQLPNSFKPAQTGSLSRDDLLIAIPSSLARSATTIYGTACSALKSLKHQGPEGLMHQSLQCSALSGCHFASSVCMQSRELGELWVVQAVD